MRPEPQRFDVIIVGSGFGGSVSAYRLAQKGYRVAVLEMGKRWKARDFAKTNWNLRRYLWAPLLRCFGPQRITFIDHLMVLRGAGVGGGSLIYANTLMQPQREIFQDPSWPRGIDWARELEPHYDCARKMLGVTTNPHLFPAEDELKKLGDRMGVGETFHPTEVGVFFGEPGKEVPDPFFGGKGPARTGCTFCGGCMVGCREGAKNTLDRNYLYLAEQLGAQVFPETTVTRLVPLDASPYRFRVETRSSTSWIPGKRGLVFESAMVVLSAGVLGTVELLLRSRDVDQTLPHISSALGQTVRTNGESLLGATAYSSRINYSKGIAIGAAIHPDAVTKIEAVKYPENSDFMRLMAVPLTGDGNFLVRPLKMLWNVVWRFPRFLRLALIRDWARQSIILLVMQSINTAIHFRMKRRWYWPGSRTLKGEESGTPIPSYLPVAQNAAQLLAEQIDGEAQNIVSEVVMRRPATAHVLGGAALADHPDRGVVDAQHEVFGYPGLYVCDGSVIPSNLAVNPSLTITALAERFCAQFPAKS